LIISSTSTSFGSRAGQLPIDIYRIAYFAQKKKRGDGILRGNGYEADAGEGDGRERGGRDDAWAGEL